MIPSSPQQNDPIQMPLPGNSIKTGNAKYQAPKQSFKDLADYHALEQQFQSIPFERVVERQEISGKIQAILERHPELKQRFDAVSNPSVPKNDSSQKVYTYLQIPSDPNLPKTKEIISPAPLPEFNYFAPAGRVEMKRPLHDYQNLQIQLKTATMQLFLNAYARLDEGEDPVIVRKELYTDLNALREEANEKLGEQFELIKQEAVSLANKFNGSEGEDKKTAQAQIEFLNKTLAESNVGNSSHQALQYQMTAFQAVFEKRCISNGPDKKGREPPSTQTMSQIANEIKKGFNNRNQILNPSEFEQTFAINEALEWGKDKTSMNKALSNPMNWTVTLGAAVEMSKKGRAHAFVTEITPLGIDEKGGVPSGFRKESKRPINLQHTKTFLLNQDGQPVPSSVHESFRGGVFPTPNAAKSAVQLMQAKLGRSISSLHINALLTPVRGILSHFKKDHRLLRQHRDNITAVLPRAYLSNFGVNEGAVGKAKVGAITLPEFGWHTSLAMTDQAIGRFNRAVAEKLPAAANNPIMRDRLFAIVQLGRDMQAVWANNDFASGDVGNNQFKLPSMWKAMDSLIDEVQYLDCMSGKDRTTEVEANAQSILHEIDMNLEDKKLEVRQKLEEPYTSPYTLSEQELDDYSTPVLTDADISALRWMRTPEARKAGFDRMIQLKIQAAQEGLPADFMAAKNAPQGAFIPGMLGIAKQPILDDDELPPLFRGAPRVVPTSPYDTSMDNLVERQREAKNRRLEIQMATVRVTQQNTGVMGMKMKLTDAVVYGTCGFDVNYVNQELRNANAKDRKELLVNLAGLNEVDSKSTNEFLKALEENKTNDFTKLLQKIAKRKAASFKPPIHVSG